MIPAHTATADRRAIYTKSADRINAS
jgi:hypothetical protein